MGHRNANDSHPATSNDVFSHTYETPVPYLQTTTIPMGVHQHGYEFLEAPPNHVKPAWPVAQGSGRLSLIGGRNAIPMVDLERKYTLQRGDLDDEA